MVNNNILRTTKTKDLDHIEILLKDNINAITYYRGSDIADFNIYSINGGFTRLSLLTVDGKVHKFYNCPFDVVYTNQESLND